MRIMLDDGAYMPSRGHESDAGLDLKTPKAFTILPGESATINTGVHVELPTITLNTGFFPEKFKTVGFLKSKSGLNVRYGITSEGVIDHGYSGAIVAKLYNHGKDPVHFNAGDKITQLVILPVIIPSHLDVVNQFEASERGDKGFGSTGR